MAAQVEVQTGEVGGTGAGGRLHLSPLTDASNKNVIEMPSIELESNKPAPNPKPRLTPKPFAVEKNPTIKPILAPKPRPEPTRISGSKPDLPNTPKPTARLVSTNPNRPAATSFRTPNSLKTGQTTKPVIQPFKPVPPLDPVEPSKSSRPIPTGRQKPAALNLAYSKSLKTYSAAEWSGTTSVKNESGESKEGSMTRAKSMEFLAAIGQDEEAKTKFPPEAAVQLRTQPRKPRPFSAIFPAAPAKTETPVPAPRWVARRPLSADLTSKFESIGLSLHQKSPKANTPPDQDQEQEKTPPSATSDSADGVADQTHSKQKAEETAAKDGEDVKPVASIKSRISLLLDASSSPGAAADPVQPVPEAESSVGVKQLIKQLTVDTTPSPIPAVKPVLKPRPLPLDRTKKFSSERSPDPEGTDRHDISKESQRGAEESTTTPNDHKTFLDFKDSPLESRKGLAPEGSEAGLPWAHPKESSSGAELHTVRASLFENIVERQSVFLMDQDESPKNGGVFFARGNEEEEDDGSLVTATYREPVSPSDSFRVSHAFDTIQAAEENRAVSESVPAAQWEDKAMTLRTRRSERARPAVQMADPSPRYLRVGALHKWTTTSFDQGEGSHKGIPQESESEGRAGLEKDQDVAAPKRLKILQGEEPQKPKATYFALTGQMQDTASPGEVGSSLAGANLHFNDLPVRSAMGGSQGQIYSARRNPSLEKAFGQISPTQEKFDELMQRNTVPSMEISSQMEEQTKADVMELKKTKEQQERERHLAKMNEHEEQAQVDFERMKELERQREFERQRQKVFEKEKRELEEERHRQKLEMEKQKRQELERERQRQLQKEQERQKEMEREREKEKQKEMEMQSLREKAEKEAEKSRQMALEQEMLKMKELEKRAIQKEREMEMERKRELEKQRQREMEKEKRQQDLERQQLEKERLRKEQENERKRKEELEKLKEMERQQLVELEKQRSRERAEKEAERLRQMALEQESLRIRELEREKERQCELEIQMEKERELEKQRQKQLDMEREQLENERLKREQERKRREEYERLKEMEKQQLVELEKQRLREKEEKEAEKLRQMALEQEVLKIKELEKERAKQRELEIERQMGIETREREKRRQRELEKEKQKQRQLDLERQQFEHERLRREQEKDRQRKELEIEKHKAKEKLEKAEAEKMRHIAKQQELERQRLKEKQKEEGQERLWLESSTLRPKVLDLDSVLRSDLLSPASPQHGDASPRWREPYKPVILDIDSFTSHAQGSPSKDSLPASGITGLDAEFGVWLQPTPERDVSWKVPAQTSAGFSSPVWTMSPQDPWELRPVEMSVDKPVMEPKRVSNKLSPEQLLLKPEERHPSPQRHRPAFLDEPLFLSPLSGKEQQSRNSLYELSHSSLGEQIWIPREPQPPKERRDAHGHRRSHGSQELNRMRSRSMSRRSAPSSSAVEGSLLRMRSRSAHRELDHHSSVQQKQSSEADSGTPVRDTDSQYGTWETELRTDDSLTPATPSSESNLSPSPRKPTPLPSPGGQTSQSETSTTDGPSPSSSDSQPLDFPNAPTTLLDNSALRSRVQLGKKRAQRVRPSKAARPSAASAQGDGGDADSWLYRDSTEAKAESKNDDSESEEPAKRAEAGPAGPPQPQRVALFPGVDPSALKAQLKKRADSDNQTDGPLPSPSQQSRSPKSPFLPRAARVLPPPGGKENGQEDSPQWLKELKSKKRLSHLENES
ncbi:nuclear-pore anchor [Xiphophorus hellerii]|uniref:nuclear-pore anchor n=1 Tax=Xiphophorus hellerii TaxID=8084 RepID=UPI0013B451CA|nr:nuclear-pore anchor-like [Xiphophorus hellerii]